MRKLILIFALIFMGVIAKGQDEVTVIENNQSNWTILNNAKAGTFYDIETGTWFAGGTTSLFEIYHIAFELGGIKDLTQEDNFLFVAGINILLGDMLAEIPAIKEISNNIIKDNAFLNKLSLGFWTAKDFNANIIRYGFYGAFNHKW